MLLGKNVAVIGGDDRYVQVIHYLAKQNATVFAVGFKGIDFDKENVYHVNMRSIDFSSLDGIVLPIGGTDEAGRIEIKYGVVDGSDHESEVGQIDEVQRNSDEVILTEEVLNETEPECVIYTGTAKPFLRDLAAKCERKLVVLFERDDIAIANSVPTAEAALQIAMEETKYTIHDSNVLVVGFGPIGVTIARLFDHVGANVAVAARSQTDLARIREMKLQAVHMKDLDAAVRACDICLNTVPVVILTEEVLENMNEDSLVIDLASKPGGTDFRAADRLGIQAIHALGLPGKVAPKTAGKILGEKMAELMVNAGED